MRFSPFAAVFAAVAAGAAPAPAAAAQRGVVHIVTAPQHVTPAADLPDLPPGDFADEVWFHLDGSGWTARRTMSDRYLDNVASPDGIKGSDSLTGATHFVPAARLGGDFLRRPWADVVIEPLEALARGELRVVGESVVGTNPRTNPPTTGAMLATSRPKREALCSGCSISSSPACGPAQPTGSRSARS